MADLADIPAAQSAGFTVTRQDRGSGLTASNRYETALETWLTGDTGQLGFNMRAYGESNASAGAADTAALGSLNSQRAYRYAGKGSNGGTLTLDVT